VDFNVEVAFDPKFLFPILIPFFSGVLPEHDHFGNIGNGFI